MKKYGFSFSSPCECLNNHGKQRWAGKNDPALLEKPNGITPIVRKAAQEMGKTGPKTEKPQLNLL
jgi:hypothetical protein